MAEEKKERVEERVSTEMIKCPSCGSNMIFDPQTQMLYCEHCETKIPFEQKDAHEIDLLNGFNEDQNNWQKGDVVVFRCDNCGAKVILNKGETAKKCPFCGTAHVEKTDELGGLKPNAVLPFAIDSEKASEFSKKWAKKRIFAPRKFKKSLNAENLSGVYFPSFTFDSKTTSTYVGRIGTTHTRVVGSGKDQRTETYVVWRNISGTYYHDFDDVLISAGSDMEQKQIDKISPFDTNSSKEYKESFLLGFMGYHYSKNITECWGEAKSKMDKQIRKMILSRYTYDRIDYLNVSTSHEAVTYKYVMIPVYVGNFSFKQKLYKFFVNGVSGRVAGKTPVSFWRVLLAVILGAAAAALIGFLVYYLMNS